jgi:hypothetical protein
MKNHRTVKAVTTAALALTIVGTLFAGPASARKVNEYEGQHVAMPHHVNEYEGQF